MKTIKNLSKFLSTVVIVLGSSSAFAQIDSHYQSKIEAACTASVRTKKLKDLDGVCACVAKTHFQSATQEASENQAISQLEWAIAYYKASSPQELSELTNRLPYMVDFDLQVVNDCLIEVRGK